MKTYYWWGALVTVALFPLVVYTPEPLKFWLFGLQVSSLVLQLITGVVMVRSVHGGGV